MWFLLLVPYREGDSLVSLADGKVKHVQPGQFVSHVNDLSAYSVEQWNFLCYGLGKDPLCCLASHGEQCLQSYRTIGSEGDVSVAHPSSR